MSNVRSPSNRMQMAAKAVESADQGVMFTLVKYFQQAWTPIVSVILYPFLLASSIIQSVTAWRDAFLAKKKNSPDGVNLLVKAGVYTASTLALAVSLFGVFVAGLGSILVTPILMCGGYALKSLYHFGSALYHAVKSYNAKTDEKREEYKAKAKEDLALGVTGALVSIALGIGLFLHKATFGLMGIVGGVVGAAYCAYKASASNRKEKKSGGPGPVAPPRPAVAPSLVKSSDASMHKALGLNASPITTAPSVLPSGDDVQIVVVVPADSLRTMPVPSAPPGEDIEIVAKCRVD